MKWPFSQVPRIKRHKLWQRGFVKLGTIWAPQNHLPPPDSTGLCGRGTEGVCIISPEPPKRGFYRFVCTTKHCLPLLRTAKEEVHLIPIRRTQQNIYSFHHIVSSRLFSTKPQSCKMRCEAKPSMSVSAIIWDTFSYFKAHLHMACTASVMYPLCSNSFPKP